VVACRPSFDVGCDEKTRFAVELEFVQCLANPHYLNCEYVHVNYAHFLDGTCTPPWCVLALVTLQHAVYAGLGQNRFLDNPAFINYLKYLIYWKQPMYAQYIKCVQGVTPATTGGIRGNGSTAPGSL